MRPRLAAARHSLKRQLPFFPHLPQDDKTVTKSTAEVVAGKKFVVIYFSAHWCPPVRHILATAATLPRSPIRASTHNSAALVT